MIFIVFGDMRCGKTETAKKYIHDFNGDYVDLSLLFMHWSLSELVVYDEAQLYFKHSRFSNSLVYDLLLEQFTDRVIILLVQSLDLLHPSIYDAASEVAHLYDGFLSPYVDKARVFFAD